MDDANHKALSLFGWTLAMETLGLLLKKEIINAQEISDTVDRCLMNFENSPLADEPDALAVARHLAEVSLVQLGSRG